jgi:hypothetical protein
MAIPAFIERVTHEDPDGDRRLSSHDFETAFWAILGGHLTLAQYKIQINASTDDETDLDNLDGLVTGPLASQIQTVMGVCGVLGIAHLGYKTAAWVRTTLGIPTP